MRKLLLASLALTIFSLSIIIFQVSCQKSATAQTSDNLAPLDITLFYKTIQASVGVGVDSAGRQTTVTKPAAEYYTVKNDGSNLIKINLNLPAGQYASAGIGNTGHLSPDGKKLVFTALNANSQSTIYALTIATGNLTKLVDGATASQNLLVDTY